MVFESTSGDLNLKDLGTGVEQLLMTLVVGLMEAPPFTLIVEEPETNLHPAGQRALLGHFQRWAEDRQIMSCRLRGLVTPTGIKVSAYSRPLPYQVSSVIGPTCLPAGCPI